MTNRFARGLILGEGPTPPHQPYGPDLGMAATAFALELVRNQIVGGGADVNLARNAQIEGPNVERGTGRRRSLVVSG